MRFVAAMQTQQQFRFTPRQTTIGYEFIDVGAPLRQADGMAIRLLARIAQFQLILALVEPFEFLIHRGQMLADAHRAGAQRLYVLLHALQRGVALPRAPTATHQAHALHHQQDQYARQGTGIEYQVGHGALSSVTRIHLSQWACHRPCAAPRATRARGAAACGACGRARGCRPAGPARGGAKVSCRRWPFTDISIAAPRNRQVSNSLARSTRISRSPSRLHTPATNLALSSVPTVGALSMSDADT